MVDGEVIWEEPEGYYHHYPAMEQVWAWLGETAFVIVEEAEGPWRGGVRLPLGAGPSGGPSRLRMSGRLLPLADPRRNGGPRKSRTPATSGLLASRFAHGGW